ncbi:MAG TPA: GNAT family N-acetyltransferase [Actinomycetes bacterium]|nr:GNAT family N-acetyltransferase [Actinomycetes bacterium]
MIKRDDELVVDGEVIGHFHHYPGPPPSAELFQPSIPVASAAELILRELAGWNITTTDEPLALELIAGGAVSTRHYSLLTRDLAAPSPVVSPEPPGDWRQGFEFVPITPDANITPELVALIRRAYPPGHPDQELGTDGEIVDDFRRALDGDRLGQLMKQSQLVLDHGRPVALAVVNRVPGAAPTGGPWLTDICRDPAAPYAGLGRSLLTEVLRECQEAGETSISLAVTEGNSARRLYDDAGFTLVARTRKMHLPG